ADVAHVQRAGGAGVGGVVAVRATGHLQRVAGRAAGELLVDVRVDHVAADEEHEVPAGGHRRPGAGHQPLPVLPADRGADLVRVGGPGDVGLPHLPVERVGDVAAPVVGRRLRARGHEAAATAAVDVDRAVALIRRDLAVGRHGGRAGGAA